MKYLILLAALVLAASAEKKAKPKKEDIVNAEITGLQHFTWTSVDSGDAETHYKTFELLTTAQNQCIFVCFTDLVNLKYIDLYQKNRMTADQSPVEGKLLSAVYGGGYPGSIKYMGTNAAGKGLYSYGSIQGGLQPHTGPVTIDQIPVIVACSDYPGGALVLVVNAEGMTNSFVNFYAAPWPKGAQGRPPALNNLGGNCPVVNQIE